MEKREIQREDKVVEKTGFIISILLMRKLRTIEVEPVAQGLTRLQVEKWGGEFIVYPCLKGAW